MKLPFKNMAEKIPAEKRAKFPILEKIIPWANQIVSALALVLVIIIIAAASGGGGPKALAKQTYKITQQALNAASNPVKAALYANKALKLQEKVYKLSEKNQLVYMEELFRLAGSDAASLGLDVNAPASAPASGTASKQEDLTFKLNEDNNGIIITGVSGNPKTVNLSVNTREV